MDDTVTAGQSGVAPQGANFYMLEGPNAPEIVPTSALPREEIDRLADAIVGAIKTVYDPEIPVDIFELGLIYKIDIEEDRSVKIDMTLTAPGCPVAGDMPGWVEDAVASVPGIGAVTADIVFDPPWTPDRMSEEAQIALNWF